MTDDREDGNPATRQGFEVVSEGLPLNTYITLNGVRLDGVVSIHYEIDRQAFGRLTLVMEPNTRLPIRLSGTAEVVVAE